jgi:NADH:ubiquinone oxidoreductase subunit 6 (subunit J)
MPDMSLAFTLPAVVTIAGALLAVSSRNILHAVFGLAISLVGVAGIFFVLNSPFVAVMEILIYIGGIAITMIFAVMLSSVANPAEEESGGRKGMAAAVALLFFTGGIAIIGGAKFENGPPLPAEAYLVEQVGRSLLDRFNLAFETLSLVLLLAIVGAIVISRKQAQMSSDVEEERAS